MNPRTCLLASSVCAFLTISSAAIAQSPGCQALQGAPAFDLAHGTTTGLFPSSQGKFFYRGEQVGAAWSTGDFMDFQVWLIGTSADQKVLDSGNTNQGSYTAALSVPNNYFAVQLTNTDSQNDDFGINWTCVPKAGLTHDFNSDANSDVLLRNNSGAVALWLMNGSSILSAAGVATLPTSYSIIGQHDFNGDGNADLVWRDGSGNVSIWFMNGGAVSSTAPVGNLSSNWTLYGTGDLNSDGKGDLLWRDANTGNVAVWYMNGGTVVSSTSLGTVPTTWTIVGEGNNYILWRDSSGDIALWGVQFGFVTGSSALGKVTGNFVVQGVGDFNGDNAVDILWRDTNSGALSIWFTNGTQVTSGASVGTLPSNWSVAQVGDYNGDGKSDILLLDNAGDLAVWEMNGAAVSSSLAVGNVGTTWQVQNTNDN